jgi:hypothetical protein
MQNIKTLFKFLFVIAPCFAQGQSSYLQPGGKDAILIERLEIKSRFEGLNYSFVKPYSRQAITQQIILADSLVKTKNRISALLTPIDKYNIQRFYLNNAEWAGNNVNPTLIKKDKFFYSNPANLIQSKNPNFFFVVNPLLQYTQAFDNASDQNIFSSSAGISGRGMIAKKLGFQFYITGNKERNPKYVREWITKYNAVPGAPNYTYTDSNAVQYRDARATLQFKVTKFIDVQAGYDRNFLGNGIRSLWLSDFSGNALFLKLNTRIWKLNFENLYMQLVPQFGISNQNGAKKYLRINTLSINATRWLNIGVFDAVVLGRQNQFEMNYILPLTFLRAMEGAAGSPDNALLGLNIKANIKGKAQVYSQLILDEFKLSEIKSRRGWWANKFGYQVGAKYVDAFGINNLDLQAELNSVRPFTFTHFDSVSNYSHFNQPLAHQLGANFNEYLLVAKYQPSKKWMLQGKLMYYQQGTDSLGFNTGGNIFRDYKTRARDFGWRIGSGNKATCTYFSINASYEAMENFFIDVNWVMRNYKQQIEGGANTQVFGVGFRWNMARREHDF